MSSLCFATVCSSNHYQYFIPTFVYSIKKAYPDAGVKVFLMGKLQDEIRALMAKLKTEKLIADGWEIQEEKYLDYPKMRSTCNSLRFLLKKDNFVGYDYVLIKDVDFIVLPHEPSHLKYLSKRLKDVGGIIFGTRGPYNFPRRPHINRVGWKGEFTRIAGGTVLLKNPEWFDMTAHATSDYRRYLKYSKPDGTDGHVAGSYREYDEVMLYRICRQCHIKTPSKKAKAADNKGMSKTYRDLHLGDFTKKRNCLGKLRKKTPKEMIRKFRILEQDPVWQEVKAVASTNPKVKKLLALARKCLK